MLGDLSKNGDMETWEILGARNKIGEFVKILASNEEPIGYFCFSNHMFAYVS